MKLFSNIKFTEIESIPLIIKDFLNQKIDWAEDFLFSKKNFERQIKLKQECFSQEQRTILSEVFQSQMGELSLSEKQKNNIKSLKDNRTFSVVTGHQLNLFSGPVFFIYKILQTIKTAEFLKQNFPGNQFIPIFWMATEDHDFEEINHFKTFENRYKTEATAGQSVGRIKVEDTVFISQFEKEFKDSLFGSELIDYLKDSYKEGRTLAEATKLLVNRLFSDYGLLILDGDDARLKAQMKSIFKEELIDNQLEKETRAKVDFIRKKYGKVQVNPREINLFYIENNRERIDANGDDFILADSGRKFSQNDLLEKLENSPENFSPNALMRPVYQEVVLPNIAYIGGNAEVAYWLELVDYFKAVGVPFPILIPRNSMLFLTEKAVKKIEKMGLEIDDFFKNFDKIISRELLKESEILELLNEKEKSLTNSFSEIKKIATLTEKSFENLVNAEEKRQLKSFERMKKRLLRAEKRKQSEKIERMEALFLEVHPEKNWQERVLNFSVFFSNEGKKWIETCYNEMNAEKSELIIMQI